MTSGLEVDAVHEVAFHGITSEGAGVGRLPDGRAVFVQRTAPGDRARIRVSQVRKRWARGALLELIEPSPVRRPPPCPHYSRCGGCTLEHLTYDAQLDAKATLVTDALRRIGKLEELPDPEIHPSPRELRYRNRVTFTLRREADGSVIAGFHELGDPSSLVDLDGRCLLFERPIAECWDTLRSTWGEGARPLPPGPTLRLSLRALAGGEVVLLVEGGEAVGDRADAEALVDAVPNLHAVWHRVDFEPDPVLLAGEARATEVWYGEEIEIHPAVFLQANRAAAEHLHELVLREAGPARGRRVVDAYAGIATYARRMAAQGASATAIESEPHSAAIAEQRGQEGFRMLVGRVEDRLSEALPADLVILNPPRIGVDERVAETLAAHPPDRIVYVSCDPATLARDVRRLGSGVTVSRLQVFDLFPQTAHVETVLTLDAR